MRSYILLALVALVSCVEEEPSEKQQETPVVATPAKDYSKISKTCLPYRDAIERYADCPARRAALMEQESSCNKFARSFDGGLGLFQFTGPTGPWLAKGMCRDLGPFKPYNPDWAIPCGIRYVQSLTDMYILPGVRTGEMRYNGGYYIVWELEQAERNGLPRTIESARTACGTKLFNGRKRSEQSCEWNYDYYKHIERRLSKYEGYEQGLCP